MESAENNWRFRIELKRLPDCSPFIIIILSWSLQGQVNTQFDSSEVKKQSGLEKKHYICLCNVGFVGKLSFQPWLCFSRCALPSQFRNLTLSGLKILPVNPAFVSDGFPVPNGNLINALIRSTSSQRKKNRFSKRTRSKMRTWVLMQWWVSLEKADIKSNFDLLPYLFESRW